MFSRSMNSEFVDADGLVLDAPIVTPTEVDAVLVRARTDLGIYGKFGPTSWVLTGLAMPIMVTRAQGRVVEYVAESVCGVVSMSYTYSPEDAEETDIDKTMKICLAPATQATSLKKRVKVPDAVRDAWTSWTTGTLGGVMVSVRRSALETGRYVPNVRHIEMNNGVTLEAWLDEFVTADKVLAESCKAIEATRKRIVHDLGELDEHIKRHKSLSLRYVNI